MSRITDTTALLETTETVLDLVTTMEEVSVLRMQHVRSNVLKTRGYLEGLLDVFVSVRLIHQREIDQLYHSKQWWKKKSADAVKTRGNGQTLLVLVSPSQRLGGQIGRQVFAAFATAIKTKQPQTSVAVVGKVGLELYKATFQREPDLYFDWQENNWTPASLSEFLATLVQYETVTVFAAQFQSLVTQQSRQLTLTGNQELTQQTAQSVSSQMYLCEPSIGELVDFFEHQVVASLFQQSLHEAHLAHLGSRITALEAATQTINVEKTKLQKTVKQLQRQEQQRRQHQRLAGMGLW